MVQRLDRWSGLQDDGRLTDYPDLTASAWGSPLEGGPVVVHEGLYRASRTSEDGFDRWGDRRSESRTGDREQGEDVVHLSGRQPVAERVAAHEGAGLVVRRPSPTDGRVTIVELSDQGRALMPGLKAAWEQLAEQSIAGLTSTPLGRLTDVLTDLAARLTASAALQPSERCMLPGCSVMEAARFFGSVADDARVRSSARFTCERGGACREVGK